MDIEVELLVLLIDVEAEVEVLWDVLLLVED